MFLKFHFWVDKDVLIPSEDLQMKHIYLKSSITCLYFASTMYLHLDLKHEVKLSKWVTLFYSLAMEVTYGI